MGGRDHSCDVCGRGGLANDLTCICVPSDVGLRLLRDGFGSAEVQPACIEFALPEGVLTYWKGGYRHSEAWTFDPRGGLGRAALMQAELEVSAKGEQA